MVSRIESPTINSVTKNLRKDMTRCCSKRMALSKVCCNHMDLSCDLGFSSRQTRSQKNGQTLSYASKEFIPALNLNQPNLGFPCCRSFFRPNFCATVAKVAVDLEARPGTEDLRLTGKVYHKNVDVLCLLYFLLKGIFHSHARLLDLLPLS